MLATISDSLHKRGSQDDEDDENKRIKRDEEYDDFQPGNVIKITVTNFTTYSYAEFHLSPTLNMIIGPNGTGKSTLVSAICLGLGGKLDLIKRKLMHSMIKSGRTQGLISILLKGEDGVIEIERKFTATDSEFRYNGKKVSEKQISNVVLNLNIQLDNLCHFLPQERVADFAALTPEKLLLETQRTLKVGDLLQKHESLIALESEKDEAETLLTDAQERMDTLTNQEQQLQVVVEDLNQLDEKIKDLKYHKLLLPYGISQDEKEKRKQLKQKMVDAKQLLDSMNENDAPLRDSVQLTKSLLTQTTTEIAEIHTSVDTFDRQLKQNQSKVGAIHRDISDLNKNLSKQKYSQETIKTKIELTKRDIENLEAQSSEYTDLDQAAADNEQYSSLRREKADEVLELEEKIGQLQDSLNGMNAESKRIRYQLKDAESEQNSKDKLKLLDSGTRGGYQNLMLSHAYHFHQELRKLNLNGAFESPVVSCDVPNKSLAGIFERIINNSNLLAVTFTSQQACDTARRDSSFNAPMRVTTGSAPASAIPKAQLKEFGFDCYLSELINGPPEVINMLNLNSKLNQIPYAKHMSKDQLDKVMKPNLQGRIPFMKFVIGDQIFSVIRSRYGSKQFAYSAERAPESRFLAKDHYTSEDTKAELARRILEYGKRAQVLERDMKSHEQQINERTKSLSEVNKEIKALDQRIKEYVDRNRQFNRIQEAIKTKNKNLEHLEKEYNADKTALINQLKNKIVSKNNKLARAYQEVSSALAEISTQKLKVRQLEIAKFQYSHRIRSVKRLIDEVKYYKKDLEDSYAQAQADYANFKLSSEATKQIQEQSKEYTEEVKVDLANLAAKYTAEGVLNANYIREKIRFIEDEISVRSNFDRTSVDRLKEVQESLERLKQELPSLESRKQRLESRIQAIQRDWEPKLTDLVFKISKSFKRKFITVASDGEVRLAKAPSFKDWRLEILVKFREQSELKILDRQTQSGGERAVSTIFFLMALQGLTRAPLRIVDEINQGMDPINEKLAHKYLVHTACKSSDSQYFLVTPKLLTGLYYHPKMKIHCIYTGPLIDPLRKGSDFMDFTNKGWS